MNKLLSLYNNALSDLHCDATLEQFKVNDLLFHAVVAGPKDGKLVLLLHGFPECWYSWRKQIPVLAESGYRVVAPDLRGYGLNDKPEEISEYHILHLVADIREFIKHQEKESAIIVAHDWGGAAAWNHAMWYPEEVEKLVILNSPHPVTLSRELRKRDSEQYKKSWYMRFFQKPSWPENVLTNDTDRTARWFFIEKWGVSDTYQEEDLALYAASYAVPGAMNAMLNWYRASYQIRNRSLPPNSAIETPTLVLWGVNDHALSVSLLDGLNDWIPNGKITRLENAGHFVQNDASEEVNEALLSFLGKA